MSTLLFIFLNILLLMLFADLMKCVGEKYQIKAEKERKNKLDTLVGKKPTAASDLTTSHISIFPFGFKHFATSFWGLGTIFFLILTLYKVFF